MSFTKFCLKLCVLTSMLLNDVIAEMIYFACELNLVLFIYKNKTNIAEPIACAYLQL